MRLPSTILMLGMLSLLLQCNPAEDLSGEEEPLWPFALDAATLTPTQRELLDAWSALPRPVPPEGVDLNEGWSYAPGSQGERLQALPGAMPAADTVVSLPHRELLPNQAMWYRRPISGDRPGLLHVSADDGAQIFLDAEELTPRAGEAAQLPAFEGDRELTIRVLNNAMHGGLRGATLFETFDYADYLEGQSLYHTYTLLVHQALSRPDVDHGTLLELLRTRAVPGLLGWPPELAPFLAGPLVQQTGTDSLIVLMEMLPNQPSSQLLLLDGQGQVLEAIMGEINERLVEYHLEGFRPGARLPYYIEAGPHRTRTFTLRVPDPGAEPFTFTAWADSQGGWPVFSRLCRAMAQRRPAFSLGIGDLTDRGWQPWQWASLIASLEPLAAEVPVFLLPGNHDYDGYYRDLKAVAYHRYTRGGRYRAWSHGSARFVALDPNASFPIGIDEEQDRWLQRELKSSAWRAARWRFVLIHQPPFSQGWPGYQGDRFIRDWVDAHAESARIDFVLSGHTHDYERLTRRFGQQETTFLVLGGAGGKLEPRAMDDRMAMDKVEKQHHFAQVQVSPEAVEVEVYNLDGAVIDRYARQNSRQ